MNLLPYARGYLSRGFSVIPCRHKQPDLKSWREYTVRRPSLFEVNRWFDPELQADNQSIGLILGAVSQNIVAIDLDGLNACKLFFVNYRHLLDTFRVASGSGSGLHLYYRVQELPENVNIRTFDGGFELRGNGQYLIAPPSPHPSGKFYRVHNQSPIMNLENLNEIQEWFSSMRKTMDTYNQEQIGAAVKPVEIQTNSPHKEAFLKKVLSEEIARVSTSGNGSRNTSLFYAALRLANYGAGGELDWHNCEHLLLSAAYSVGLPESEAKRTIASAWRIGSKNPKKVK